MKLKLIDQYVLKLFLSYFFTALTFVLGGIVIFDGIDTLLGDSSFADAIYKALQTVPPTLELIVSYVGLLAGLLTFSALYKNGEIISMKIAGLNQFQIIRSIFVAGIAIVFFLYYNQSYLVRFLNAEDKVWKIHSTSPQNNWVFYQGSLVRIDGYNSAKESLAKVTAFILSDRADLVSYLVFQNLEKKDGQWTAANYYSHQIQTDGSSAIAFKEGQQKPVKELDLDQILSLPPFPTVYQPFGVLWRVWQTNLEGSYLAKMATLVFYKKIAYLFSFFIFLLLSISFSESQPRFQNNSLKVIGATLIYYFYWFLDQFFFILAKEDVLPALVAVFFMPLLLLFCTILVIRLKNLA